MALCPVRRCTLITPSVLHVESEETIVIDAQGYNLPFDAKIFIRDFPKQHHTFSEVTVSMNNENKFLGTSKITISSVSLLKVSKEIQFVYVTVKSPTCNLEKVILLSLQSGYLFLQTDKAIYTPGSAVLYRVFSLDYKLHPKSGLVTVDFQTPDGNIVKRDHILHSRSGIPSMIYKLHEFVSLGIWTVSAKYEHSPEQIYTTNFEVKEYGNDMAEANLKNIPIVKYRYKILFTKTSKYFKPGINFDITGFYMQVDSLFILHPTPPLTPCSQGGWVAEKRAPSPGFPQILKSKSLSVSQSKSLSVSQSKSLTDSTVLVTHPDGSPAQYIPVVAEPGAVTGMTSNDGTTRLTMKTSANMNTLQITVKTEHSFFPAARQPSASMTATAYKPLGGSGNYLHIRVSDTKLRLGDRAEVNFLILNKDVGVQNQIQHFTYLVLNKGRIIRASRVARQSGQTHTAVSLDITEDFIPSFRIVAYYMLKITGGQEIVSDSVSVDVMDSCLGTMEVTGEKEKDNEIQSPDSIMKLKLRADHNAYVALVAVDKGAYERNKKFTISQSKVWDSVLKSDTSCTPGSGPDGMGVFYDAGLALQMNSGMTTAPRSDLLCEVNRKRLRRSTVSEGYQVIEEFLLLTSISTKKLTIFLKDTITTWEVLAVSLSKNKGICVARPYEIKVRKSFFIDLKLPYSVKVNEQVEINAILYNYENHKIKVLVELSHSSDFCSLSTSKNNFRQEVDIDPLSSVDVPFIIVPVKMGHLSVEVKASVAEKDVTDGIKKKLIVVVSMQPDGIQVTRRKSVILEPSTKGKGCRLMQHYVQNKMSSYDGVQNEIISSVDIKNIVPHTDFITLVTIQGILPESQTVKNIINESSLNNLLTVPSGTGEDIVVIMARNVFVTNYLDSTGQWRQLGVDHRQLAFQNIMKAFPQQLIYRKLDNSYVITLQRQSSTWLTAFVAKVFAHAWSLVAIEKDTLCGAIKWLILVMQKSDGSFMEEEQVFPAQMTGGIKGSPQPDVTLSAFVLITFMESKSICVEYVNATVVLLQALTQYRVESASVEDLNLDVSVDLPEKHYVFRVNKENAMLTRSVEVTSFYYALMTEQDRKCNNYDLSVTVKNASLAPRPAGAKGTISITVCMRYLKSVDAIMPILDIAMLTGFSPDINDLEKLPRGEGKYISRFEINKGASKRSNVIFYLDRISHTQEECLKFNAHQFFKVGLIQPASVTVYNYNTPETRCTKFYHVEEGSVLLGKICHGVLCHCASENCFMQQRIDHDYITAELRFDKACEPKVEYVYKVTLTDIQRTETYDNYVMTIQQIFKEDLDKKNPEEKRNFISHVKCKEALNLKIGRDYLVWGMTSNLWNQPAAYTYLIGKDTWIEWWPNDDDCQNTKNKRRCEDLFNLKELIELNGCPN
ncbi:A.superbus venom factor 1-like [Rhinophrynus dorsalis]